MQSGAEWVVVWNGRTGKEIARAPWPDRQGLENYNLASRNQIAVAYLDSKTPCLITLRGTYTTMKAEAWELAGGKLQQLWAYNGNDYGGKWRGQGAHFTHCADIDGDGRDEVILGSAVIDDTGAPLWTTGMGHPDGAYIGDINPRRPGLEVQYNYETAQRRNGICQADARTGRILWGIDEPTEHVHGQSLCADIDPTYPGLECYGQDSHNHEIKGDPWLLTSDGKLISREQRLGFFQWTGWWDADLQRELVRGQVTKFGGGPVGRAEGSILLVADLLGDWREEIVTSVPGEVRIYSTPIPATDRRVCLLQDPLYRADVRMQSMGYPQAPMTTDCLEAVSPGLNMTAMSDDKGEPVVRLVVSAPMATPLKGVLRLTADGATVVPDTLPVDVQDGERLVKTVTLRQMGQGRQVVVRAVLDGAERPLHGEVPVVLPSRPLTGVPMTQAESFTAQGGGEVHLRDDKPGAVGKSFSHWDSAGHWLEWGIEVPKAGAYRLVIRYCAAAEARRKLTVDGQDRGVQAFPNTGGFGATASEWDHFTAVDAQGKPLSLDLSAGTHLIRMENVDGKGLNLDYLALRPAE
ncbi:MAG: hypothetical protein HYU66_08165 [Armatimonadetes bacterium]|nr:hypothetical protein [Armatimonadota bacterium]